MPLTSGTNLGPYEILGPLGAGGMGEVYRATDTRLHRDIALKILPESFARDADRLQRFEQEARVVAGLNHPNILAVYDIGQYNSSPFLVSELLEGETLRVVLDRGPLPQRKTIEYGVQIALGLAAAHEKGIVHRDLKPENIFVTRDGRIKILDFGLAKLAQSLSTDPEGVTLTSSNTAAGVVMGTAGYMAPEQVRGGTSDARTDIFALGALLYEMLSGRRAFRRETTAETMAAVLRQDPPEFPDVGHPISPALERIVRRCLEKNPEQRFQSARDLSFALSALSGTETSSAVRAAAVPRKVPLLLWLCGALVLATVARATWLVARRAPSERRLQFAIPIPGNVSNIALSRDGSTLAFVSAEEHSGLPMLYVQRIGSPGATLLAGTQGASYPFLSPDAANVAFFASGKLKKMAVSGGTPQILASVSSGRGGSWGSQGVVLYSPDAGSAVWRVNADGSGSAPVTQALFAGDKGEQTHRWPVFLPDDEHFLFWGGNFSDPRDDHTSGIYVSSLDGKEKKLVVLCHSSFAYDSQHLFYADEQRQLVSVAFDPSTAKVSGTTTAIANVVGFQPSTYWAILAAAQDGTLIYNASPGAVLSALTWMDRTGKELGRIVNPGVIANPTLSPDDSRVAVDISDQKANNVDVWLLSTKGAGNQRFTFSPAEEVAAVWSRDASVLAYRSVLPNGAGIFLKRATGEDREKLVLKSPEIAEDVVPNSWSADDQKILLTVLGASHSRLAVLPAAGGSLTPFLPTKANQTNGVISHDGKWVAYASDELGAWEVYVTSFPEGAGKWQVSRGGGTEPRWRGDGKEIFYIAPDGVLMAVAVGNENGFSTGTPEPLFQIQGRAPISATDVFTYDAAKDGKRFLVNRYVQPERSEPLTILLHAATGNERSSP